FAIPTRFSAQKLSGTLQIVSEQSIEEYALIELSVQQVLKDVIKEERPTPQVEEKKPEVKPEVKVEQKEEKKELVLCPVCGKSVESTAKACPFCSTPLDLVPAKKIEQKEPEKKPEQKPEVKVEPKPEVKVEQKVEVKTEVKTEQPAASADDPAKNATNAVENVEKYIKELSAKGIDVTLANNLLRLAKSFMRSKNYEKAIQYAEKATAAAKDLEAKAGK
ncbi:MAG: hypothetical protein QXT63_00040, partial [Thermoplasmata archaeon]